MDIVPAGEIVVPLSTGNSLTVHRFTVIIEAEVGVLRSRWLPTTQIVSFEIIEADTIQINDKSSILSDT